MPTLRTFVSCGLAAGALAACASFAVQPEEAPPAAAAPAPSHSAITPVPRDDPWWVERHESFNERAAQGAERGDIGGFAKLALRIVRVETGDLVSVHGSKVIAYLDSARPKDLNSLRNRLRDHALRLGFGDIEIEALGFPANEDAVRELLGAPAANPDHHGFSIKRPQRRGLSMKGARWT